MRTAREYKKEIYKFAKTEYRSPVVVFNADEFENDLNILFNTKKILSRFLNHGAINEKLIINNVVITINNFGPRTTCKLYRIILNDDQYSIIKSILLFLGCYDPHPEMDDHKISSHPIMDSILQDIRVRYNLTHIKEKMPYGRL